MKIFKINFFVLYCIFTVLFLSCKKENEISPLSSTEQTIETQNRNNDFFSNERTYSRLAATAHNWDKQKQAIERSDEETINQLKDYVDDLDVMLNDKYVNKLINDEGYPLWDASKIYTLDDGGRLIFTPIFKENSDKINAVFVFSNFGTDEYSYIMMTRNEMTAIASDIKDPNFHLLNRIYKDFDEELFALNLPQYDDWAELVLAVNVSCYHTLGIADDGLNLFSYVVCSSGCTNTLWSSGIVDTQEERTWVRGNCTQAGYIDRYLEDNGSSNPDIVSAANLLLGVALLEDLTFIEFLSLIGNVENLPMNSNFLGDAMFLTNIDLYQGVVLIDLEESINNCYGMPNSNGDRIDCSTELGQFVITIYADQPIPETRATHQLTDPGHSFVSVSSTIAGENKILVFGFYPLNSVYPGINNAEVQAIFDDSNHEYSVSVSFELSCSEFNIQLNEFIEQSQEGYHLDNYNCTDFAILSINEASNCEIPDTNGFWPAGAEDGGSNPGDLGEDLRTMPCGQIDLTGGNAPSSNCM